MPTLIMSLVCMVIIYIIKVQINMRFKDRLKFPVPVELIVVSMFRGQVDYASLAPHRSYPAKNFGLLHVINLSSPLTERRWFYSLVSEIMHGEAPEVFLHQLQCWCDVKPKRKWIGMILQIIFK